MDKRFIVNRQGKDFVLYVGLVDQAHREGLKRITTALVQAPNAANGQMAIVHAQVETARGVFDGIGDANPDNVGRMIAMHTIRMAETRAKARALRDAVNVTMVALEELSQTDQEETVTTSNGHTVVKDTGQVIEKGQKPAPANWITLLHERNAEIVRRFGKENAVDIPADVSRAAAERIGAFQKKILDAVEVPA